MVQKSMTVVAMPGGLRFRMACNASFQLDDALLVITKGSVSLQYVDVSNCVGFAISVPSSASGVTLSIQESSFVSSAALFLASSSSSALLQDVSVSQFVGSVVLGLGASVPFAVSGGGQLKFVGCTFSSNIGLVSAGVVQASSGATVDVSSSSMFNNSGVRGGFAHINGAFIRFHDTDCNSNTASIAGGCVYAVAAQVTAFSLSSSVTFRNNVALLDGGAIHLNGTSNGTFSALDCKANTASRNGGCLCASGGFFWIGNSSTIHSNHATFGNGSGVSAFGSAAQFSGVTFDGNAAVTGGAFFVDGGSVNASGLVLTNNRALALGFGAAGMMVNGVAFQMGISAMSGNSFSEGVVCFGSQGSASGNGLSAVGVVCGLGCQVSINGNDGCLVQAFPASPANSSVRGNSFTATQNEWLAITADVRSVYLRPAKTDFLRLTLKKGALFVANLVKISSLEDGVYKINFTTPSIGVLQMFVGINDTIFENSPGQVTVSPAINPTLPPVGPNLTGLWIALALIGAGAIVLSCIFFYRRYVKRVSYLPIADTSKRQASYGGTGFLETDEEV